MSMSTAVNSLRITPGEWGSFHFPRDITSGLKQIGDLIQSVTKKQKESISQKMCRVLSNRLELEGVSFTDAKTEFLSKTPFNQDIYNHFSHGICSVFAQGGVHEYSYEDILKHSIRMGGYNLRERLGDQLAQRPNYRISLSLDVERTAKEEKLFFVVTEKEGSEVLSTTSFSFHDLEEEKKQQDREQLIKLQIESGQELEEIEIEINFCNERLRTGSSNCYYQNQMRELKKKHEKITSNLKFYTERLELIAGQSLTSREEKSGELV